MHKKLLGLLRSMSTAEQEKLSKFVRSPYYNERKELATLLQGLYAFAPHFDEKEMESEGLFFNLFPERTFDKSVLNKLNSKLFQLAEQFVVVEQLNKQAFDQKKKIAATKVGSYRLFINSLRQLCHLIEDHPAHVDAFIADQVLSSSEGREKLEKLKTQIESSPVFYSKKWLLEQIQQLSA